MSRIYSGKRMFAVANSLSSDRYPPFQRLCPSSTRGNFAPKGMFDNIWSHLWLSLMGDATSIQWVETRDTAEHPSVHRTDLMTKKDQTQMSIVLSTAEKHHCAPLINGNGPGVSRRTE